MSRSKRDQRGKRLANEIGSNPAIIGDKLRTDFGWDFLAGGARAKRAAKKLASGMRRLIDKRVTEREMQDGVD